MFHPAPAPTQADVEAIVERASKRILRFLQRRGVITLVTAPGDGEVTVVADETIGDKDPLLARLFPTMLRYRLSEKILAISPNGNLAASASTVYRVSDGTALAALTSWCDAEAVSSDSSSLYCVGEAGFVTFDLRGLK